jgi:hypothetical protein
MKSRLTMGARPARWALPPNPRLRAAAPVALLLLLGLPACNERHPLMSAPSPEVEKALLRMDEARCDRAARCGQMGSTERFPSPRAACIWTVGQNERRDVDLYQCPKGIDEARLQSCIDSIRAASCEPAMVDLAEIEACGGQSLCPSQGEPRTSPGIPHPSSNAVD